MARIRTVKPEIFEHEVLFDAEKETGLPLRLAWIGLWTQCDREGRFMWRPRQLKVNVLPYDEIDFERVLDALWRHGFIVKYAADGNTFGCIPSWHKHQFVNNKEKESDLPEVSKETIVSIEESNACATREARVNDASIPFLSLSPSLSPSFPENQKESKREFENVFWPRYPHKVGKRDAGASFLRARTRHSLETIMDGLERYANKTDDRPWCNPATWLNQDRCLDQPAAPIVAKPTKTSHFESVCDKFIQEVDDAERANVIDFPKSLPPGSGQSSQVGFGYVHSATPRSPNDVVLLDKSTGGSAPCDVEADDGSPHWAS